MSESGMVTTARDVDAVLIPVGTPVVIPAGSRVRIVHRLGDHYTVEVGGNLARVPVAEAAALGLTGEDAASPAMQTRAPEAKEEDAAPVDEDAVREVLKTCYDPEIPVNIVDLGLVYDVHLTEDDEGRLHVEIVMTLTAPGCGMGPFIVEDVRQKVLALSGVADVHVELVFDPPWDRSMMSDEARLALGMF
ncbi:MAG: putative Fe-S cluster assembly protein SufT [Mariprofundaceae bacterium]